MLTGWMREIDQRVRRFGGELPVDAFLPELTAGHLQPGTRVDEGEEAPASRRREPASPGKDPARSPDGTQPQSRKALEREVEEFMNRDSRSVSAEDQDDISAFMNRDSRSVSPEDEDDISEFLNRSIDPNLDD